MYEHRDEPLLSRRLFAVRMLRHAAAGLVLLAISIAIGMLGYHAFADEPWLDAWVNATMLLGGMGQVGDVITTSGKVFSGLYSLYSGMVFLVLIGTMLTPVFHRVLHRFHWDAEKRRNSGGRRKVGSTDSTDS
jgi:hypothetical protein